MNSSRDDWQKDLEPFPMEPFSPASWMISEILELVLLDQWAKQDRLWDHRALYQP
jgi:hypothetical protein